METSRVSVGQVFEFGWIFARNRQELIETIETNLSETFSQPSRKMIPNLGAPYDEIWVQ